MIVETLSSDEMYVIARLFLLLENLQSWPFFTLRKDGVFLFAPAAGAVQLGDGAFFAVGEGVDYDLCRVL